MRRATLEAVVAATPEAAVAVTPEEGAAATLEAAVAATSQEAATLEAGATSVAVGTPWGPATSPADT